jgi:hypothetical protein
MMPIGATRPASTATNRIEVLRLLQAWLKSINIVKAPTYQCLSWVGRPEMGCEAARPIFSHHDL